MPAQSSPLSLCEPFLASSLPLSPSAAEPPTPHGSDAGRKRERETRIEAEIFASNDQYIYGRVFWGVAVPTELEECPPIRYHEHYSADFPSSPLCPPPPPPPPALPPWSLTPPSLRTLRRRAVPTAATISCLAVC